MRAPLALHQCQQGEQQVQFGVGRGTEVDVRAVGREQGGVLVDDRLVQVPHLAAGLDAEVLAQLLVEPLVRPQGLGLVAGPVEGEHEEVAGAFPGGLGGRPGLQAADHLVVAPVAQFRVAVVLERRGAGAVHHGELRPLDAGFGEFLRGPAPPQSQRGTQEAGCALRLPCGQRLAALVREDPEAFEVEGCGRHPQHVAGSLADE